MNTTIISDAISDAIVARNCFLVEINISKDNDIEIVIESEQGTVTLDDCVDISRKFEELFDRDKEDYSLTVTSAGLDQPFKVLKQFVKAIGSKVEVSLKGGRRITGELTSADQSSISLKYSARESIEGKKKKETVEHNDTFDINEVTGVKPVIEFE